jgi:hypothetical protein
MDSRITDAKVRPVDKSIPVTRHPMPSLDTRHAFAHQGIVFNRHGFDFLRKAVKQVPQYADSYDDTNKILKATEFIF